LWLLVVVGAVSLNILVAEELVAVVVLEDTELHQGFL